MDDPKNEIESVVKALIEAPNAAAQRETMQQYFAPDASFDHPLCAVRSSPQSRDTRLLPIYQWLKIMFDSTIEVDSVGWDEANGNRLYVDARQKLKARLWPVGSIYAPKARLLVILHLSRAPDGRYYIKRQEDLYQVQELPGRVGGPLMPWLIMSVKLFAGLNCMILAFVFQLLGVWSERSSSGRSSSGSGAKRRIDKGRQQAMGAVEEYEMKARDTASAARRRVQDAVESRSGGSTSRLN